MKFKTQKAYDQEIARRRRINNIISKRLSRRSVISQVKGGSADVYERVKKIDIDKSLARIESLLNNE